MATYTTDPEGTALAAVRGRAVLLMPADAADALNDIWADLADPDPTRAVLDRLTVDGLAETPSFALAVHAEGGGVRIVVRGPFVARVDLEVVEGAGVSTWVERVVKGRTVVLKAADATAGGPPTLPIVEGVVPAASVTSTGVEVVAEAPEAVPEPSTHEEAEPEPASEAPSSPALSQTEEATPEESAPEAAPEASIPESAPEEPSPPTPASPAAPTGPVRAPAFPNPPAPIDDATVVSVQGLGAREAQPASTPNAGTEQTIIPPADTQSGDHDGMTIVGLDLQRLRQERDQREQRAESSSAPAASDAKALGLRMPDGTIEPITHEVVLGRSPSASQLAGGRLPRVVAIGAGDHDISRNHVRVTVEGDTVVITDLHSRNGTHVAQPGKAPIRLRAGEPTPVLTGTVVDLGGGWTLQVVAI